jgi:iron complex transport system substrate-binding protein
MAGGIAALAAGLPATGRLAAQDGTPGADGTPTGEWSFTDDRGVTITLPQRPTRVVAQVSVGAALWDYGVRPIAVFGPQRLPDGTPAPQAGNLDLDVVESAGEVMGEIDLEKLVSLQPDLIVVSLWNDLIVGDANDVLPMIADTAPTLGIQIRNVPISQPIARFEEVAAALGADLGAPDVVAAKETYTQAVDDLTAAIAAKPGLTVMFTSAAPELLYVANPQTFGDLLFFQELGLDIVVPEVEEDAVWEELSWEQGNKYPVDLILNDARLGVEMTLPEELAENPIWSSLPAVQANQVGPWYLLNVIPSHASYAPVLQEMAGVIETADPDIV